MTGDIVHLHGDPHAEILALLPWLVTGHLDAADAGRVEAHLVGCGPCRAALDAERRLVREVTRQPAGVEDGWADMRQRLDLGGPAPSARQRAAARPAHAASLWRRATGWRLAAPFAFASLVGLLFLPLYLPARFNALGSATPIAAAGNVVVIFQPDTREAEFRDALRAGAARLVDGPTAANAYVLAVPAATRSTVIAKLRQRPEVVLAEPIDAGGRP